MSNTTNTLNATTVATDVNKLNCQISHTAEFGSNMNMYRTILVNFMWKIWLCFYQIFPKKKRINLSLSNIWVIRYLVVSLIFIVLFFCCWSWSRLKVKTCIRAMLCSQLHSITCWGLNEQRSTVEKQRQILKSYFWGDLVFFLYNNYQVIIFRGALRLNTLLLRQIVFV